MKYPPYKQSINGNIHPINNPVNNQMEYPPFKQWETINQMEYQSPYKQSINGNIHPINNQLMGISTL